MNVDINFHGGSLRHDGVIHVIAIGDVKTTKFDCPVLIVCFPTTHLDSTMEVLFSDTFPIS